MSIENFGWNRLWAQAWTLQSLDGLQPGRILADYGQKLRVVTTHGELLAESPRGRNKPDCQPAVGDWIALEDTGTGTILIRALLPRRSKFSRAAAGQEVKEQVVAANVDTVFLVQSLNRDFNLRRLERYLIIAWDSGALPVIVLTKADCTEALEEKIVQAQELAPGVAVHAVSAATRQGLDELRPYLAPGQTVALLGSSGVGKSTLANALACQDLFKTQAIRESDDRGRHTTTHREIVLLPDGGMILDTPGMRSLSLWEADSGLTEVFGDIEALIAACRFTDCSHSGEPGCAVAAALASGALTAARWESWQKLQRELAHLEAKKSGQLRQEQKAWGKKIAKLQKEIYKR